MHTLSLVCRFNGSVDLDQVVSCHPVSLHIDGRMHFLPAEHAELVPRGLRPAVRLRDCGDDGVQGYRIPGLVRTSCGALLACYDVRRESYRDLQGDIDIGISRSTDGGRSWEPMQIALTMGEYGGLPR